MSQSSSGEASTVIDLNLMESDVTACVDADRVLLAEESQDEPGFSSCDDDWDFDDNHNCGADDRKLNSGDDPEMKKLKVDDSEGGTSSLDSNVDEHFRDEALSNVLILQKIFSCFKTKALLSSVSLVSKTWNREARRFVHNHRIVAVRKPGVDNTSNCQFFQELDKLCCQMRQSRRPIPWNLLKLNFNEYSKECFKKFYDDSDDYNDVIDKQMVDRLKVKYLEICGKGARVDCPAHAHKPVATLLHHASSKLRRLKLKYVFQLEQLFRQWQPEFPELEEIMIYSTPNNVPKQKEILTCLLDAAPRLKRIKILDLGTLEIIPAEKFELLEQLVVQFEDNALEDDNIVWRIAERKPAIRTLFIRTPPIKLLPKFNKLLKQIHQGCHQSLRNVDVSSTSALEQLSFLWWPNLASMIVHNESDGNLEEFWETINSIDYNKKMPRLQDLMISFNVDDRGSRRIEWPKGREITDVVHNCASIRSLKLALDVHVINMSQIKNFFPNVSFLKLFVDYGSPFDADFPSFSEIWELYPFLKELKVYGEENDLKCSYDSQFCGIFDEEAQLLREKDEEYLKAVHIVPIRPSVLTMPNLQVLLVDLKFVPPSGPDKLELKCLTFTSKVSEFLAFKRMKHARVRVCGVVGLNDIDEDDDADDEDSDDDEGEGDESSNEEDEESSGSQDDGSNSDDEEDSSADDNNDDQGGEGEQEHHDGNEDLGD